MEEITQPHENVEMIKSEIDLKCEIEDIPEYKNVGINENEIDKMQGEVTKEHQCDTCEKSFSRSDHLKRHIACVHEGQKNHKCHLCEKTFGRSDRLKHHISSVHNEDPNYNLEG